MEDIVLRNGKTVKDFKELPISKIIQNMRFIQNEDIKNHMCEWLYIHHYSKIQLEGNLTTRVRKIESNICLRFITNECFDRYDFERNKTIIDLDKTKLNHITQLNNIYPMINKKFWIAVIQRIINEKLNTPCDIYDNIYNNINCTKNKWQFRYKKFDNVYIMGCQIYSDMSLQSNTINIMRHGSMFIELWRKNEWMSIEYKNITGFVRCLISIDKYEILCNNEIDLSNSDNYKFNDCFHRVKNNDYHTCKGDCNYTINSISKYGSKICHVNICRNLCNEKNNNFNYNTKDILKYILINLLNQFEILNTCPCEEKFNNIFDLLNNLDFDIVLHYISNIFNQDNIKSLNITMNNVLDDDNIKASCNIIIVNELIDIKCTKSTTTDNYELLQLLGYTSLIYNKNMKINKISTINLMRGFIKSYDISTIQHSCFKKYYNILTNNFI